MNFDGARETISLLELNQSIRIEIKTGFDSAYWVVAEINEHKVNYSGHCYLELVEKETMGDSVVAKARATIWAGTYRRLLPYFETTAQHAFGAGIKVLVKVTVEFHALYGLSLNIIDIDPVFTLGDLQQQKQEAINRLKEEGVFLMNKELAMPRMIQKIAVISSASAAGYGDFMDQLQNNEYGYKYYVKLFTAVMQGENAEQSIIDALERVYLYEDFFDAAVIIRGGGSKTDLSCFDRYWLAYHVAQFPLPVLTGIGHEQDDTVTDMVANTKLKTPTAVASFIIEMSADLDRHLEDLYEIFRDTVKERLDGLKQQLMLMSSDLASDVKVSLMRKTYSVNNYGIYLKKSIVRYLESRKKWQSNLVANYSGTIERGLEMGHRDLMHYSKLFAYQLAGYFKNKKSKLESQQGLIRAYHPQNVLDRGYSITFLNGQVVKSNKELSDGDEIETRLKKGKVKSKVSKS